MSPIGDWYEDKYGNWQYDPSAPASDISETRIQNPIPAREVEALHGDVGDDIDPDAPDPTGDEVTDPDDPNYVEPWRPG